MEKHDEIADEMDQTAGRMDEMTDRVQREVDDQREDWEAKKKAEGVPGAIKTPEQEAAEEAEERNEFELEESENQP
jgi:hypothetical protein